MQATIIAGAVVVALCAFASRAFAEKIDACTKDCREYHKVCVQAHSQGACQSNLEICMKHCRQR